MLYIIGVSCLCALFLVARSVILVSSGTIAIRKTRDHFRGLAPGIHLKWPWQYFEIHDVHLYNSEVQTYCVSTKDSTRIYVRISVDWTEFQRICYQPGLDLIAPIRATIGKYPVTTLLSSQQIRGELEWAIKSTSHTSGNFFFKIEVLSILHEEVFVPPAHEDHDTDTQTMAPVQSLTPKPPLKKESLRCIYGGKHGQNSYRANKPRTPPPHLRLYQGGGNDDGAA